MSSKKTPTPAPASAAHKRHQYRKEPTLEDMLKSISKKAMKRLMRRAGVKRVRVGCYDTTRALSHNFLDELLSKTIAITLGDKRKTIDEEDVKAAYRHVAKRSYYGNGSKK